MLLPGLRLYMYMAGGAVPQRGVGYVERASAMGRSIIRLVIHRLLHSIRLISSVPARCGRFLEILERKGQEAHGQVLDNC